MEKISVLISVYYREKEKYLYEALQSIFLQTVFPDEVIIVKDGPLTEELDNVIHEFVIKYSVIKVIELPKNVGLGKALNIGLEFCTNELVARMDSDDISKPIRFERQLNIFHQQPHLAVLSSWIDEFENTTSSIKSIRKLPEFHKDIFTYAKSRNPINHPVVMFRKSAILEVGGYEHFPFFEDYYLWVKLLKNGFEFYNIQESLLFFRSSSDMFKRRGGLKYILAEVSFQNTIYKMGFVSLLCYMKNIILRFLVRILPNSLRTILYIKILRK